MPNLLLSADTLFLRLRASAFLHRSTLFTRILLAAGFVPTGMVKLLGQRFTVLDIDNPVGLFFEAMFQTGLYWRFLGASQILAGLLLLVPRLAHLGAALFLPIMVNIFVITISIDFRGTPVVTGLMLLAVVYLCLWDYHRFRGLVVTTPPSPPLQPRQHRLDGWELAGFWIFGVALMAFFMLIRGQVPRDLALPLIALGVFGGLLALGRFVLARRWRV